MVLNLWCNYSILTKINRTLHKHHEIKVSHVSNAINYGLFWYRFALEHTGVTRPKGVAGDIRSEGAILKAWGEFVERYSFHQLASNCNGLMTSNGFAAHTTIYKAKAAALAELIERDVFLSCWLIRKPAAQLSIGKKELVAFRNVGAKVELGCFGNCMGLFVGIGIVQVAGRFAIATAACSTLAALRKKLLLEAKLYIADFLSSEAPIPIRVLPKNAKPRDHLRLYLSENFDDFRSEWIRKTDELPEIQGFQYALEDLSHTNPYASETGYSVFRATSSGAQNLWFGPTERSVVNLDRIQSYLGRRITLDEINLAPHPLA
jgi:hypothetical protein